MALVWSKKARVQEREADVHTYYKCISLRTNKRARQKKRLQKQERRSWWVLLHMQACLSKFGQLQERASSATANLISTSIRTSLGVFARACKVSFRVHWIFDVIFIRIRPTCHSNSHAHAQANLSNTPQQGSWNTKSCPIQKAELGQRLVWS